MTCLISASARGESADLVFIGDSHSAGCFGQTLDESLRKTINPHTGKPYLVRSAAACGSSASSWLNKKGASTKCGHRICPPKGACSVAAKGTSPPLEKLLAEAGPAPRPRVTVIALGSNMLKSDFEKTRREAERLIDQALAAGSHCVWIGPPQATAGFMPVAAYDGFVERLKSAVEARGCQFVDSGSKTSRDSITDRAGLHYDCLAGREWARRVFEEIHPRLRGPVLAIPRPAQAPGTR